LIEQARKQRAGKAPGGIGGVVKPNILGSFFGTGISQDTLKI
jgi:hypothetical protein